MGDRVHRSQPERCAVQSACGGTWCTATSRSRRLAARYASRVLTLLRSFSPVAFVSALDVVQPTFSGARRAGIPILPISAAAKICAPGEVESLFRNGRRLQGKV